MTEFSGATVKLGHSTLSSSGRLIKHRPEAFLGGSAMLLYRRRILAADIGADYGRHALTRPAFRCDAFTEIKDTHRSARSLTICKSCSIQRIETFQSKA